VADARATIKINVTTDKKDFASALGQMNGLNAALGNGSTNSNKFTQSLNKTTTSFRSYSTGAAGAVKSTRGFNTQTMTSQKLLGALNKSMRAIFWIVIALGIEFAITAATLASVNAAFTVGRMAVKAYHVSLGLLAGALASVTAAVGIGLAAFQEYTAAMTAFSYKGVNDLGDGMEQSSSAMRNFAKDTSLATMGVVALTQAYSAMAKQAPVSAAQRKALAGALDFTTTAEDPKKAFQSLSQFIGLVTKAKKVDSKATRAAQAVSPEFAKAVAGQKDKSAGAILASLSSGQLATSAGVSGNYKMQQTLVGQFQSFLTDLVVQLTDFGRKLLEPAKDVLESFYKNFRNAFRRTEGIISDFATGTMMPGLITIGDTIEEFSVKLLRDYLPKISGGADWLRKTFSDLKTSFSQFVNSLDKFRRGSKIITDTFGEPLLALVKGFGRNAEQLGYLAEDNEEAFLKWGKALEGLIFSIFDFFAAMKVAFTEALPVLTQIVNGLASLVRGLSAVISLTGTLGGGGGNSGTVNAGMGPVLSSALTMGLMYAGFKGRRRFRGGNIGAKSGPTAASKYAYQQTIAGAPVLQRMFGTPNMMGPTGFVTRTRSAFSRGSLGSRLSRGATAMLGGNTGSVSNQAANLATNIYRNQTGRAQATGFSKTSLVGEFDEFLGRRIKDKTERIEALRARKSLSKLSYRELTRAGLTGNLSAISTPGAAGSDFANTLSSRKNPITGATLTPRQIAMFGIRAKVGGAMTGRVEAMQAGLRGSFTPGLGMAGSLITASGVTSKIGNETARSAVDMGLAGSYFGKKGIIAGAGIGVLSKTTNYAAGAIAGGATGAQIAGTLTAGLPPQAQAIGKALGFAIGTAVGIFTVKSRRAKVAKGIADEMVRATGARSIEALLNSPTLSTASAIAKIEKDQKVYQKAISMSKGGSGDQAIRDYLLSTGSINEEQAKSIDMSDGAFIQQLESNSTALKMQGESYKKFENNVNALTTSTGKTREEIFKLAKETGVNLFDASRSLTDNFKDMGLAMRQTADSIKNSMNDIRATALNELDKIRQKRDAFEGLRSSQKDLAELGAGATQDDFANYQQAMSDYVASAFPDDPAKQIEVFKSFATGAMFTDPTSPFFGNKGLQEAFTRTQNVGGVLTSGQNNAQAALNAMATGYSSKIAVPGISGLLNMSGSQFARGDVATNVINEGISSAIANNTFNQEEFEKFLISGDMENINNADEIQRLLASFGVVIADSDKGALKTQNNLEAAILAGSLDKVALELHQQFLDAISSGFDSTPEWWETQPEWWRQMVASGFVKPADTRSSRRGNIGDTSTSRTLGRTLSAHSRFDSALTGSRKITSAFRTFGLGSPSSDHAAGRAYDLTGQNLGQYAKMISDSGGFAEFHGAGGSRHLHVVPPLGDTTVTRATSGKGSASSGGGVAVAPVTVNVYGAENQSPQDIARQVIYEIEKAQRNWRERY